MVGLAACTSADGAGVGTGLGMPALQLRQSAVIAPGGDSAFGYIVALAAGPEGEVYVADQSQSRIAVFSPGGVPLRYLGRPGSGPGEFSNFYSLAWSGDTLVVFDPGNGRLEYVDRHGAWVESQTVVRASGRGVRLWQASSDAFYAPAYVPAEGGQGIRMVLVRRGLDVNPDTLVPPKMEQRSAGRVECSTPDGAIHFWTAPSRPSRLLAVTRDGRVVTGWSDSLHLKFTGNDSVVDEWEGGGSTIAVPDSAWEASLADFRVWHSKLEKPACEPAAPERPSALPILLSVEFDDLGRAWLERSGPEGHWFEVRDSVGTPLFRVAAPQREADVPFVVRDGRFYYVRTAEDGSQEVVVAEVE